MAPLKEAIVHSGPLSVANFVNVIPQLMFIFFIKTIVFQDASKEDQIEGLVKSVKWQMSTDRKVGALKQLQGLIWKQGYDKGDIKGQ